jgi:uncharacterized membrane protein
MNPVNTLVRLQEFWTLLCSHFSSIWVNKWTMCEYVNLMRVRGFTYKRDLLSIHTSKGVVFWLQCREIDPGRDVLRAKKPTSWGPRWQQTQLIFNKKCQPILGLGLYLWASCNWLHRKKFRSPCPFQISLSFCTDWSCGAKQKTRHKRQLRYFWTGGLQALGNTGFMCTSQGLAGELVVSYTTFGFYSVVLNLMLLLISLPATLYTNHSKHVETSYIVLRLTFSVATLVTLYSGWHLVLQH